jgi:hypothetical protein
MKKLLRLTTILLVCVIASCQKDGDTSFEIDADAQRFIDSSGITDFTQRFAVNNLVIQLKNSSLWTKFLAIYPMVGGSANTTKWNLRDPVDSDSGYRLTFHGTPVYAGTGVLFPATSDYADTHLSDELLNYNDNSISYYSGTQNNVNGYDMGCYDRASPYNEMAIYNSTDASNWFGYYDFGPKPAITKGLFMVSVTASNVSRYENGAIKNSSDAAPVPGFTGLPILIGSVSGAPSSGARECALASIGDGLTDAEALTFYNIVQNFESSLGR